MEPFPNQSDQPQSTDDSGVSQDDKNMALVCHLLGILTNVLGPLIFWVLMKEKSPYVDFHGKQAVNFNITILIAYMLAGILVCAYIGILLIPVVMIVHIVFAIIAMMKASQGERYVIPVAIPLIQ